jgi:hypothetical protein
MTAQMTAPPDLSDGTRSFVGQGMAGHASDGASVESCSSETIEVVDSSTGLVVMLYARVGQAEVDAAVGARRIERLLQHRRLRRGQARREPADAARWPTNSARAISGSTPSSRVSSTPRC